MTMSPVADRTGGVSVEVKRRKTNDGDIGSSGVVDTGQPLRLATLKLVPLHS